MKKSDGFTAVELLVTIFIAVIFLLAGYQLYSLITNNSGDAKMTSTASNIAYDYLQRYKTSASSPCEQKTFLSKQSIPSNYLTNVTISVSSECPYGTTSPMSKLTATVGYGVPQKIVTNSTLTALTCPAGFIPVPGSDTYDTSGFCVMKYEGKWDLNNSAVSAPKGLPGTWNTQTWQASVASEVCDGCHLISEAEWMTIAQNIAGVSSNWSSGTVGTGYIYSGHSDFSPSNMLEASEDDSDGYFGTGNYAGDSSTTNGKVGNSQKRTLNLSNGQVIWDFSGNAYEWTSGQILGGSQPGIAGGGLAYRDWNTLTTLGSFVIDPYPSGTGISGASSWTSVNNGIGTVYSNTDQIAIKGIVRSGSYQTATGTGIFFMDLNFGPDDTFSSLGFRYAK